jgi:excisionase family DNA binding protein
MDRKKQHEEKPRDGLSYTVSDAARRLGVSESFVYTLLGDGRLTAVKLGRRTLVTDAALRDLLSKLPAAKINMDAAVKARIARRAAIEDTPSPPGPRHAYRRARRD